MGAVYKAQHEHLDKIVAVKVLPQRVTQHAGAVARFKREMKAVGKLNHPNIVQAPDAGEIDGVHYLTMEFVEGTDLQKLVQRRGPLSIANACKAVRQAAQALAAAPSDQSPQKLGVWEMGPEPPWFGAQLSFDWMNSAMLPGIVERPTKLPGIQRWNVDTVWPRGYAQVVLWSPDGQSVVAIGYGWFDAQGNVFAPSWRARRVAWRPDNRLTAERRQISNYHALSVCSPYTGETVRQRSINRNCHQIDWSPLGNLIATGSHQSTITAWTADDLQPLWHAVLLPEGKAATFSVAGELISNNAEKVDPYLVCYLERDDGKIENLTPAEFRELISATPPRNGMNQRRCDGAGPRTHDAIQSVSDRHRPAAGCDSWFARRVRAASVGAGDHQLPGAPPSVVCCSARLGGPARRARRAPSVLDHALRGRTSLAHSPLSSLDRRGAPRASLVRAASCVAAAALDASNPGRVRCLDPGPRRSRNSSALWLLAPWINTVNARYDETTTCGRQRRFRSQPFHAG